MIEQFKNKKVLVLGLAKSGESAARLLDKLGAIVTVNDGKPFDEDFTFHDFISFGKKTGQSKGAGIGGFIMNRVVLQHEGTLEMINPDEIAHSDIKLGNFLKTGLHFRIKLPIVK